MIAIWRRELQSYFVTPIGYIYLGVFYFFAGLYFSTHCLLQNNANLSDVFASLFTICVFLIPVLTMRLLSEERKNKTDQLLLTAPVHLFSLVMGKLLAAFTLFAAGASITLVFGVAVDAMSVADWPVIVANFIGLLALGLALISLSLFLSATTENQMVAAIGGFSAGLFLLVTDSLAGLLQNPLARGVVSFLSFNRHYVKFTQGLLDVPDLVFFLSVCALFVFFTIRTFERRRWH